MREEDFKKLKKFVAHDVVAPLANNKAYFSLLKSGKLSPEEKETVLSRIEENTHLALTMIAQMKQEMLDSSSQ